jgi:RNA polymerase sigma-70 factor (ECF subfamily)
VSTSLAWDGGAIETRPDALRERLRAEAPKLRAFVAKLFGRRMGRSDADADDVAQETLSRAWRYRKTFDAGKELGPWLRAAALRVFLDHRERSAKAPAALEADPIAPARDQVATGDTLEHWLAVLSPVERDVILGFHRMQESVAEIATRLAMPEGTVKSHLHRARRKLAERMKREDLA